MDGLKIMSYQLEEWSDAIDVRLERMKQQDGSELWAIREGGACLNKKGQWEFEPIPSSRTSAFFKRCRFKSVDEATAFWIKGNHHSRFEHYKARANTA